MKTKEIKISHLPDAPEHLDTVSKWIFDEFVDKPEHSFEWVKNHFRNRYKNKPPITLAALSDDYCIGTISLFENDLKTRKDLTPWLASLYVDAKFRRNGVGRLLIKEISKVARSLDYETIYLRTETAGMYYKKLNWIFMDSAADEQGKETEIYFKQTI